MKKLPITGDIAFSAIAMGDSKRGIPENEENAFALMDRYIALGGDTFDSARMYNDGGADRALGKWLKSRGLRDRVNVVTKGSHPTPGAMFVSRLSAREIEKDLEESLSFMGIPYSDLHLLHRDDVKLPVEEIVPVLSGLVRSGKTRAVGASNWTVGRIIEANRFAEENGFERLCCSQLHFGLAQTTAGITGDITHNPMNDVEFGWYRESRFPVMAFGVQARGWFAARADGGMPKESPRRYYDILPENHRRLERLKVLSDALGVSLSAITTAYVRDSGLCAVALCSFSSEQQLLEAFESERIALSGEQIRFLETGVGL